MVGCDSVYCRYPYHPQQAHAYADYYHRDYRVAYTTEDAGNYFYVGPGEVERHHVEHYLPGLGKHLRIVVE